MRILLKGIKIIDPASPFHQQVSNVFIVNDQIAYIGSEAKESDEVIEAEELCVSAGWVDLHCWVGDPGLEHKEDFASAAQAAARGGFTQVLAMPDVQPVTQTKNAIAYVLNQSQHLPVSFLPTGAVSMDLQGKDLTEMIDLHQAGALAFTEGENGIQGADLLIKALHYVQFFNGLILQRPQDNKLSQLGLMHEGIASTRMGLKGIPVIAEEIMVARDLRLLEYTGGKLHFTLLSTAGAIDQVREAKAKGLAVTCDVASYQIAFTDEEIADFDTNYKVNPPFRSATDRDAIIKGLQDGTIDALVSGHKPHDPESKNLEFDLAEFGIINLETAFAVANTFLSPNLTTEEIIHKFTVAPRQILGLPAPFIIEGAPASLTLFNPNKKWRPEAAQAASKSHNSPFFGKELTGQVLGIVHKNKFIRNPEF